MLNIIWLSMMFLAVICGLITGRLDQVVTAVTQSARVGFDLALGLAAVMTLWLGIMRIASDSGLVKQISNLLRPLLVKIFPDVPSDHPAMGAMVMSISANLFGLGNAATPFGLQAMKELQTLNQKLDTASDAMCMFVVLNASSLQLIPTSAIAYLALNGSQHPSSIVSSTLICSVVSTLFAFFAVRYFAKGPFYRLRVKDNL